MPCLIALVVFGILGVFSAAQREIAKEAFDCVFKRLRFKPCESGLDKRLKSQVIGKLMKKSPRLARFGFQHFEVISWVFTFLMFTSTIYTGIGMYNFVMYGNCHGENSQEECIYEGLSELLHSLQQKSTDQESTEQGQWVSVKVIDIRRWRIYIILW